MNYLRIFRCCRRKPEELNENCEFCNIPYMEARDNIINICLGCQLQQMNILCNKYNGTVYDDDSMIEITYNVQRKLIDGTSIETYLPEEETYKFKIPKIYGIHKPNSFSGLFKYLTRQNKYSKYGILSRNEMSTSYTIKEITIERYGIKYEVYKKID
ncbi:hypothetical protein Klosneuvirus_6_92 [Klosneuvirus KNV1]|uniref:Uncharacterized protein n=1 Tax=Klosneuvirus KNV1 TaxID=1977640 RepID=A0A1V0SLC8_9VIRU|nr:hypothetical protein Klosneuvirus_6_92 [Klosneuvirus KNV1]